MLPPLLRFLFLPPDFLPRLIVPCPEVLPLDWLPTVAPDEEPLVPEPTVDPLPVLPVVPDVPFWPELLPVVPDPVCRLDLVVPCEELLPELVLLDWA